MTPPSDFSQVIRAERQKRGLTQRELAERIGISDSYVAHLEAGSKAPSVAICRDLSHVFGFSVEQQAAFLEAVEDARIDRSRRRIRTRGQVVRGALRSQATSEDGGLLRLVDLETGDEVRVFGGSPADVTSLAVTGDCRRGIWGSQDRTVRVWDLEAGREEFVLRGHSGSVTSVAVTPGGRRAVSGAMDRTLRVWELEGGREELVLDGHTDKVTAAAVTADGRRGASGSLAQKVRVWDLDAGHLERELGEPDDGASALALSPDGEILAAGGARGTVKLWAAADGQELRELMGLSQEVVAVGFRPGGVALTGVAEDGEAVVWDIRTGAVRLRGRLAAGSLLALPAASETNVVAIFEAARRGPAEESDPARLARELAADPDLLAAYRDLRRALQKRSLRETVLNTLSALARSAER